MRESESDSAENGKISGAPWRTALMVLVALLGAAVIAGIIFTIRGADRERDRALALQSHSYEVMILARTLSETMASAEASLGRYVISGEKDIGQVYSDQWLRAGTLITQLRRSSYGNPGQIRQVEALQASYGLRGNELARIAWYTQHDQNQKAFAFFNADRDTHALRKLNQNLDNVIATERNLLQARTAAARTTLAQSATIAKALVVFGILLILAAIALAWVTVRALGERATANAEAASERERSDALEAAVTVATERLREEAHEREAAEAKLRQIQKMEAVGQLTGGIAHDFNNMLAVVIGGLELARRQVESGTATAHVHIDNAMEGAKRAAALTRRLLAFARAEPLLPEAVEGGALIRGMHDLLERTIGETITVETHDAGMRWKIWADRHQLENAILNLAVNARDAMQGRGTLTIETGGRSLGQGEIGECGAGDYVTISVCDTGCGMAPDVLDRVFEPFFTTKPVGKGTGLGLSQIFGFVRQSEGEITIHSVPDAGTTVTLFLPRHHAAPARIASDDDAGPAPVTTTSSADALDILVVEDDERVLTATTAVLEELGHRVTPCDDPFDAPAKVREMPRIDCIISDVMMPGQTGPEMIERLGSLLDHVGVVFVTGYAGDTTDSAQFGGHVVLRKPYTINGMADAVSQAMANAARDARLRAASG